MSGNLQRVIVTGGNGRLGRATVREFANAGYDVLSIDISNRKFNEDNVTSISADLRNLGEVVELFTGIDSVVAKNDYRPSNTEFAVVHLAAIPGAGHVANTTTYLSNVAMSYTVMTAARLSGVRRFVYASSETLLGLPFAENHPPYFPVDEEYPARPRSAYALAKAVDEEVSRHLVEWLPDSAFIGLRLSNIMHESDYSRFPEFENDPASRSWNAWGYIDARDAATACRLAVESDLVGAHNYIIAAPDTVMSTSSRELAQRFFPEVPFKKPVDGNASLLSIEKAERELGFRATHLWRDQ